MAGLPPAVGLNALNHMTPPAILPLGAPAAAGIIPGADPVGFQTPGGGPPVTPLVGNIGIGAGPGAQWSGPEFGNTAMGSFRSSAGPSAANPADVDAAEAQVDNDFWNTLQRISLIGNRAKILYDTSYSFRVAIMDSIQVLRRQIYYIRAVITALEAGMGAEAIAREIRDALRRERQRVTAALAPVDLDLLRGIVQLLQNPALNASAISNALHDAIEAFNEQLVRLANLIPPGIQGQNPLLHVPVPFPADPGMAPMAPGWQAATGGMIPPGQDVAAALAPVAGGLAPAVVAGVPGIALPPAGGGLGGAGPGALGGANPYDVRGGHRRRSRGGWTPKNQKKKHKKHKTKHKKHRHRRRRTRRR
jgi:hypothetical protein